ncbi:hypothetical protein ANTPLA_LOCUS4912 [Anthophora plagiata]
MYFAVQKPAYVMRYRLSFGELSIACEQKKKSREKGAASLLAAFLSALWKAVARLDSLNSSLCTLKLSVNLWRYSGVFRRKVF